MEKYSGFQTVRPPMRAVVVGGGFIGLEMAENLVHRGFDVTVIEMADQVLGPLDREYGRLEAQSDQNLWTPRIVSAAVGRLRSAERGLDRPRLGRGASGGLPADGGEAVADHLGNDETDAGCDRPQQRVGP